MALGCVVVPSPPAGVRGHCETGAANRSTPVIARPAQPIEALLSLRDRRSQSKHSRHCETGAAGRSNLLTAPPALPIPCAHPAWSSRAAREGVRDPRRFRAALGMTSRCTRNDKHTASSIVIGSSQSKHSRHCETGAAGRSNLLTAPPALPIPCAHPAWSSRAAREVVRDPLRFLAALGMTRMRHRQFRFLAALGMTRMRHRQSSWVAANRSTPVIARPAQPVEALLSLRDRRSRSKQSPHCATGATNSL
jgi:hypothetical protein